MRSDTRSCDENTVESLEEGPPGDRLDARGETGDPLPADGADGALFREVDSRLRRPIGILAVPGE